MQNRYHPTLIGLHWLTLVLLAAVYALIELRGIFPKGTAAHDLMKAGHFMLGLVVLGLVAVRVPLRLVYHAPAITPAPPAWQQRFALAMHVSLYAFLVVMPLLGWLTLSAKGRDWSCRRCWRRTRGWPAGWRTFTSSSAHWATG